MKFNRRFFVPVSLYGMLLTSNKLAATATQTSDHFKLEAPVTMKVQSAVFTDNCLVALLTEPDFSSAYLVKASLTGAPELKIALKQEGMYFTVGYSEQIGFSVIFKPKGKSAKILRFDSKGN